MAVWDLIFVLIIRNILESFMCAICKQVGGLLSVLESALVCFGAFYASRMVAAVLKAVPEPFIGVALWSTFGMIQMSVLSAINCGFYDDGCGSFVWLMWNAGHGRRRWYGALAG